MAKYLIMNEWADGRANQEQECYLGPVLSRIETLWKAAMVLSRAQGNARMLMESHPGEEAAGWPRSAFAVHIPWVVH